MTTRQRVVLPATLVVTMTAGVFPLYLFSVLAAPIIDGLGISRTELGVLGAVNTGIGALSAPLLGRLTDRVGAGRAVVASLALSATGMALIARSGGLPGLFVGAAVGGLPQGWGNPATNGLISARVPPGRRGTLTGVKQSGVTLGIFLAGATLPALANPWGWRGAAWTYAAVFAIAAVVVAVALAPDPEPTMTGRRSSDGRRVPLDRLVWRIAVYAFFMGLAAGAAGRFVPLFAEESLGFSTAAAGLVAALGGLLGIGARIVAARLAEHRVRPTRLLTWLSLVGAAYGLLLASLTPAVAPLLWLSPVLNAVGTNAWNAVAMMSVIMFVATYQAGRASGIVMFGFLGGLATAGPVAGAAIDHLHDYRPVWLGTMTASLVAAAIMFATDRRRSDAMMG